MRRRFALVFNASAGVAGPHLLKRVIERLEAAGATVEMLETASSADATAQVRTLAMTKSMDAVIAAGGDGTIRAVAAGASGTELAVGVVPLGTGNVLKYEIGLTSCASEIAQTLLSGPELKVRGGLVNGAAFFLMVGAGFDGRVVSQLNFQTKRRLGRLAYGGPIMRTLVHGPDHLDVEIDGAHYDASWVIVSNVAHYGGSFVLTRETQLGANKLLAVLVEKKSRVAILKASLSLALGRLADPKKRPHGVKVIPATRVRISSAANVPVEVDGDDAGTTPVVITAQGPEVRLIVPDAYVADVTKRHTNHVHSSS